MPYQFTQTGAEIQDILDLARNDIAAEYDPTASYVVGDYCTYEDSMYICTGVTTGTFAPAKWSATTVGDVLGSMGSTMSNMAVSQTDTLGAAVSLTTGTWADAQSVTLPAGSYLVFFGGKFQQGTGTGYRQIAMNTSSTAPSTLPAESISVPDCGSYPVAINMCRPVVFTYTFTLHLWARFGGTSTCSFEPFIRYTRLR